MPVPLHKIILSLETYKDTNHERWEVIYLWVEVY